MFRLLSYQEIGSAALLSRALAGLASGRVVFVLPGSRGAVALAMEKLLLPKLAHLAGEAIKTRLVLSEEIPVRCSLLLLGLLALVLPASGAVYTWVDEDGVTHIVDDPAALPEVVRPTPERGAPGCAGSGRGCGRPSPDSRVPSASGSGSLREERTRRLIRGAVEDLERGEVARASAALEAVLRNDPKQAEAHWYMALLARRRGRYESAEVHLRAFLAAAGEAHAPWREAAEQELARSTISAGSPTKPACGARTNGSTSPIRTSASTTTRRPRQGLRRLRRDRPGTDPEEAHGDAVGRLGAAPREPLGVMFYGKAAYLRAHRHRFSFQTVGFFDGRIHVVSAAHPAGELRALLFHEYTHAVFREQTGEDRPFWLNEGLAELSERAARRQPGLTRSERSALWRRIEAARWIPLRRLSPSFTGLDDADARAAYLISTAAACWLEDRTDRGQRGRLLELLGTGVVEDEAFVEVLGLTTDGIDAAVQEWIRQEFPASRAGQPPL